MGGSPGVLGAVGKLLVANRGEIACRVMRTARKLGIPTVAVYSSADAQAKHVSYADEAYCIGDAPAKDSYLRGDRIIDVALSTGATHVHPGYGFLSENADFASACAESRIGFVGPPASAIRAMGDKIESKTIMEKAGVPVVPGYHGADQSLDTLASEAAKVGFPLLVKAALGGGGKGMKIAQSAGECEGAIQSAQREALSSFGDQRVLLERYVGRPRHIEVQIVADGHGNAVHLYERDCSIQRRHQKVIEEAPAFGITPDFRARLHAAALEAARAVGYVNAGTVEFLVDANTWDFYFMEMNTRLQVEHPVSEAVTGIDLVEWQLRIAGGDPVPLPQDAIKLKGHAVEARLYAENPKKGFLPATGLLEAWRMPAGAEEFALSPLRIDSGVRQGDAITDYYDPMIAKVITVGVDRRDATHRMQRAMADLRVAGVPTNAALIRTILAHEAFLGEDVDTHFIERHAILEGGEGGEGAAWGGAPPDLVALAAACACWPAPHAAHMPWSASDGFRIGAPHVRAMDLLLDEISVKTKVAFLGAERFGVELVGEGGGLRHACVVEGRRMEGGRVRAEISGRMYGADVRVDASTVDVWSGGSHVRVCVKRDGHDGAGTELEEGVQSVTSPMPGRVVCVFARDGQRVSKGDPIIALEAMKMEYVVKAAREGVIEGLTLQEGSRVEDGSLLAKIVDPS